MKLVEASGSPRKIGRATGEQLREEIRGHIEQFPPIPDREAWERRAPTFVDTLKRYLPAVLEEMKGTAEGASIELDYILALNLPMYADELVVEDACTNIVFSDGPDGPIWGKNNDGGAPGERRPACARLIRRNDAIPLVNFTFCGMVATLDGVNAEGLAMGHSSVGSVFQQSDHHVPIRPWGYEGMLTCRTTAEFVRHMAGRPTRGKGYSVLCVDRGGAACSVEAPCPIVQVRRPTSELAHMNCVNHYQLAALSEADRRDEQGKRNSKARQHFLDEWLRANDDFSLEGMKGLLRHHGPISMCRHGDNDGSHTEYSMIALPRSGRVLYLDGYPCEEEFTEFRF